jgi:uncharacterized membrane protein
MFLYAGEYENVDDAKGDLQVLKELHREHLVGTYDAAVVTNNEAGKVKIVDKIEKPTQHGGWAGMAVGAAMGLIFPPSVLVGGLLGAGALIGHLRSGMSNSDLKEVGEMLEDSEAALIVVGEATIERAVDDATRRAKKELKKEGRREGNGKGDRQSVASKRLKSERTENGAAQRTDPRRSRQPYGESSRRKWG